MVLHKVLNPSARFNPVDYTWIGRIASFTTYGVVWHTSPVQTIEDAKTQGGDPRRRRPVRALRSCCRSRSTSSPAHEINIVKGYKSASELGLAMERGEVQRLRLVGL